MGIFQKKKVAWRSIRANELTESLFVNSEELNQLKKDYRLRIESFLKKQEENLKQQLNKEQEKNE